MPRKIRETSNNPTQLERHDRLLLTADLLLEKKLRPTEIHNALLTHGYTITKRQLEYDLKKLTTDMNKFVTPDELTQKKNAVLEEIALLREMALAEGDRKEMRMLLEFKAKIDGVLTTGNNTQVNVQNNTLHNTSIDEKLLDKETLRKLIEASKG